MTNFTKTFNMKNILEILRILIIITDYITIGHLNTDFKNPFIETKQIYKTIAKTINTNIVFFIILILPIYLFLEMLLYNFHKKHDHNVFHLYI
mgnify:CR=1 FL=1